jgi:DNA (cytosine-5)-methyltransferase 1
VKLKALDLFCGAGGASRGLADAGFEVTGVDITPQPRYPYRFIQADVLAIDWRGFDLVWASPPCQAYSNAQKIQKRDHPRLIEEIRKRLKKSGAHYVIENVPGAPLLNPIVICGAMFPELKVYRHRLFECSFAVRQPWHPPHTNKLTKMGRAPRANEFMHVVGNFSGVKQARQAMQIDWMSRNELSEAIPPLYANYFAKELLRDRGIE